MPNDARLNLVLDRQTVVEGLAVQDFHRLALRWNAQVLDDKKELGDITYAASQHQPPLQAADLYVFAWSQYLHGSASDEVHYALRSLTGKHGSHKIADANYFRGMLAELRQRLSADSVFFKDVPTETLEQRSKS